MLNALKNPWVLGGGAAIGVVFLLLRGGRSGADAASPYSSVIALNNAAASEALTINARSAGAVALEQVKSNVIRDTSVLRSFDAMFAASTNAAAKTAEVNAGLFKTQIQSQAAVETDRRQNATRLRMAEIQDAGLTTRTLADFSTRFDMAKLADRSAFMHDAIAAGVQTHQIDVSSRTAVEISKIQADAFKTAETTRAMTALSVAQTQSRAAQSVASSRERMHVVDNIFSIGGSAMRGIFAPTSLSAGVAR